MSDSFLNGRELRGRLQMVLLMQHLEELGVEFAACLELLIGFWDEGNDIDSDYLLLSPPLLKYFEELGVMDKVMQICVEEFEDDWKHMYG